MRVIEGHNTRTDLLERRRALMQAWASYLASGGANGAYPVEPTRKLEFDLGRSAELNDYPWEIG